jgi:hypothetical protein
MSETPDIPDAAEVAPGESAPYGAGDKVLAGVVLFGVVALAVICVDVITGGRLTRSLSAPLEADDVDD